MDGFFNSCSKFVNNLMQFFIDTIGYRAAVRLEDTIQIIAGFFLGVLAMVFFMAKNFNDVGVDTTFKTIKAIRDKRQGKDCCTVKESSSFPEAFDIICTIFNLRRGKKNGEIKFSDLKLTWRLMIIAGIIGFTFVLLAALMMWHVVPPTTGEK